MQLKKVKKLETEFYASEFRFQMKWVSTLTAEELEQAKEEAAAVEAGRMKPGEMTARFEEYRILAMRKKRFEDVKNFNQLNFSKYTDAEILNVLGSGYQWLSGLTEEELAELMNQ